jgi:hypothetical protein
MRENPNRRMRKNVGTVSYGRASNPCWGASVSRKDTDQGASANCRSTYSRQFEEHFGGLSSSQKTKLAHQLGHESFESLLAASRVVTLSDGSQWWFTADRNGAWTAWNLCPIEFSESSPTSSNNAISTVVTGR